jgi:hypothetical protein
MAGLLSFLDNIEYRPTPISQGLLNLGAAMLANSGPSLKPVGFGQALGQGLQAFSQGADDVNQQDLMRRIREMQLQAQTPAGRRQAALEDAKIKSEVEALYPKAPSIPTGFTRGPDGSITPMQITGPNGPTDYMQHQLDMARQRAQIPGYGEDLRLRMALEDQQLQREAAARNAQNQQQSMDIAREKLDMLREASKRGKQLPINQIDKLTADQQNMENALRLQNTFKPEYGGHYLSGQFDLGNRLGRTFGDDTGQAQWWQDHQMQKNKVRNDLFGSALTPGEQAEWEKASINPTMDPKQIQLNLDRQYEIEKRGYQRRLENIKRGGYDISGFEQTPAPAEPARPAGVSDEKWNSYLNYLRSKGAMK